MARNLQQRQWDLSKGVATNLEPESIAAQFLSASENMDGFDTFRGIGKTPGSSRINGVATDPIKSIHYFELFDLDRTSQRRLLVVTDDEGSPPVQKLMQIDLSTGTASDTGAWNAADTSQGVFALDAAEQMFQAEMNNRLHLSSPNQTGPNVDTGGVKFDGTRTTNWGLLAPGEDPNVAQPEWNFEDTTAWTGSGTNAAAYSSNYIHFADKTATNGAIAFTKNEVATTRAGWDFDDVVAYDTNPGLSNELKFWVFLPSGAFQKLSTGTGSEQGAIYMRHYATTRASATNYNAWQWNIGELVLGWNLLTADLTTPDDTVGGAPPAATAVQTIEVGFRTAANADVLTLTFDRLFNPNLGAPSGTAGAPTDPASTVAPGSYRYRVTFLSEYGHESNAGPASAAIAVTAVKATDDLVISGVPTAGNNVTIGDNVYVWRATPSSPFEVAHGASAAAAATNLAALIANGDGGSTPAHPDVTATAASGTVTVTARVAGIAGGDIAVSDNDGNTNWTGAGASGVLGDGTDGTDGQDVSLTAIPLAEDTSVIARRIYRDLDGDGLYLQVGQIDDNATTTFTDDVEADELLLFTPPLAGSAIDSTPPGALADCLTFENRVWGVLAEDRITLVISDVNEPEAFPLLNQLQFDEPITSLEEHATGLLVYTTDRVYRIAGSGTANDPFAVELVNNQLGANGPESTLELKGFNLAVREKQAFLVEDVEDEWYLNGEIQDQWDADYNGPDLSTMFIVHDRRRFRVLFFGLDSGGDYVVWAYQYATQLFKDLGQGFGKGIDPQDLRVGRWDKIVLPATGLTPNCGTSGERDGEEPETWIGTQEGFVEFLGDPAQVNWASGAAVAATFTTTRVPLNDAPAALGEPRFIEIAADSSGASTWSCTVTIYSGATGISLGTTTWNIALPDGESTVRVGVPEIGGRGDWADVTLSNSTAGASAKFHTLRLYYIPRGTAFSGPQSA